MVDLLVAANGRVVIIKGRYIDTFQTFCNDTKVATETSTVRSVDELDTERRGGRVRGNPGMTAEEGSNPFRNRDIVFFLTDSPEIFLAQVSIYGLVSMPSSNAGRDINS